MDGIELERIRGYAFAKASGFMGVEGLHFDDDDDDDEYDEDDEDDASAFSLLLKIITGKAFRESDNELREKVDEWRRNVC